MLWKSCCDIPLRCSSFSSFSSRVTYWAGEEADCPCVKFVAASGLRPTQITSLPLSQHDTKFPRTLSIFWIALAALNNMIDFFAGEEDPLEEGARLAEDNRGCSGK